MTVQAKVFSAWASVLGEPPANGDVNFFDAGGDSLKLLKLCAALGEHGFGEIDPAVLLEHSTPDALVLVLSSDETRQDCLVQMRSGSGRAIVFIHPLGGTVTWYVPLARLLPPECEVWAIQAQGLDPRREFHRSIHAMAEHYTQLITGLPDAPLMLAGYSMGGILALEIARRLRSSSHSPSAVVLLDTVNSPIDKLEPDEGLRILVNFGLKIPVDWEQLRGEDPNVQAETVRAKAVELGLLPGGHSTARVRRMIEIYDVNVDALRMHRIEPYLGDVSMLVTAGNQSSHGWEGLLPKLSLIPVPGNHFNLLAEGNVGAIAERLIRLLATNRA